MIEIQLSMLSHYEYCPKNAYISYVSNEFVDNEFTIQGREIHQRVDSGIVTKRRELLQIRSVWLKSEKYGLIGKADMIEEKDGEVYPVEYKRGRANDWKNDQVQLTAQAFCIEEMLNLKDSIKRGFIYYHLSNTREEIILTPEVRLYTQKIINEARNLLETQKIPEVSFSHRCLGCSLQNTICLPKETEKIKHISYEKIIGE